MPAPSVVAPPPTMAPEVARTRPWLRAGRAAEPDRAAGGAGWERFGRAPEHQRPGQHFGCAAHGPIGRGFGATFDGWRDGHRHGGCSASSIGIWRRLAHRPGQRKSRRRIGRAAGCRRGRSAAQQQRRRKRLGRGRFQPARIESWPARQRRQRRLGHVSLRRRQAGPGRIGRRRWHRPRRRTGQRILRPGRGSRQGRHRPRIGSHGARRNFALSRPRRRRHRNQRHSRHARSLGKGRQQQHCDLAQLRIGCEAGGQPGTFEYQPRKSRAGHHRRRQFAFRRRIQFLRRAQGRQGLHHLHHDHAGHGGDAVCRSRLRGPRLRRRPHRAPSHALRSASRDCPSRAW